MQQAEAGPPVRGPREELGLERGLHHDQEPAVREEQGVRGLAQRRGHLVLVGGRDEGRRTPVQSGGEGREVALDLRAQRGGLGQEDHVGHLGLRERRALVEVRVPVEHGVDAAQRLSGAGAPLRRVSRQRGRTPGTGRVPPLPSLPFVSLAVGSILEQSHGARFGCDARPCPALPQAPTAHRRKY